MKGAVLMVQGTASNVGKSLIVAGLCRLFHRRGLRVAPFKAQNLSLNSYVTRGGGEIGRAQATQAAAAGIEPTVDMNPILLKPEGNGGMQAIVLGKPFVDEEEGDADGAARRSKLSGIVQGCLERLRAEYDVVVIEGAGSPAEINLRERDIANMHVALMAQAPVILVGDIDRGGVFAHLVGTLELLQPDERALVAGLVINRFHGDPSLLYDGTSMLEERTGVPVLGVIPHVEDLRIPDEDSVALDQRSSARGPAGNVDIAVIRLPRLSNTDDMLALEHEPGVTVRYVTSPLDLVGADLVIIPGTKDTRSDLQWLRDVGLGEALIERAASDGPILGVCGGYQMLGETIEDPHGVEGPAGSEDGLGLLPIRTVFHSTKTTTRVRARVSRAAIGFLTERISIEAELSGYEIHMGQVEATDDGAWLFERDGQAPEGKSRGAVAGTLMHGVLGNDSVRTPLLQQLGRDPGAVPIGHATKTLEQEFDRLADVLAASLDLERLDSLLARSREDRLPEGR